MLISGQKKKKKKHGSSTYIYGFKFDEDHEKEFTSIITDEIKEYVANKRLLKN